VTDRAPEEHDHDAAERLIDLLLQAEETAGARNDEAAIARAAVIDARPAVARSSKQQRSEPDPDS
jgi:hypothetical protein